MKTAIKLYFGLLTIAVIVNSCEGFRCADGVVKDADTNLPLEGVKCEVTTGKQVYYTDSSGKFEVCNQMSGCLPGCKDITVQFSKEGYESYIVDNPNKELVIPLQKQ